MAENYQLGDIIEVFCPKCKLNLDASIAVIVDGKIMKVQCRTCMNFVDYHEPVPDHVRKEKVLKRVLTMRKKVVPLYGIEDTRKNVRSGKKDKSGISASPLEENRKEWLKLTEMVKSSDAKVYFEYKKYTPGDYILHKKFGLGFVKDIKSEREIVVIFRDSTEILPMDLPRGY